jgi:large-conductance mechanosensitive channel
MDYSVYEFTPPTTTPISQSSSPSSSPSSSSSTTDASTNDVFSPPLPPLRARTFYEDMIIFLTTRSQSILTVGIGMSVGIAFKDVVTAFATSIVEPFVAFIIITSGINNYYNFTSFLENQNTTMNVTKLIQSIVTCILILIGVYLIYNVVQVGAQNEVIK